MSITEDLRNAGRQFECLKIGLTHKRDGLHITLLVQPDDADPDMFTDLIGTRYMAVLVPLTDEDEPKVSDKRRKASRLLTSSHMLCREPRFWQYLNSLDQVDIFITTEAEASDALRKLLGITSRSELRQNKTACDRMASIIGDFEQWTKTPT